jgi:hypothetical protein
VPLHFHEVLLTKPKVYAFLPLKKASHFNNALITLNEQRFDLLLIKILAVCPSFECQFAYGAIQHLHGVSPVTDKIKAQPKLKVYCG